MVPLQLLGGVFRWS